MFLHFWLGKEIEIKVKFFYLYLFSKFLLFLSHNFFFSTVFHLSFFFLRLSIFLCVSICLSISNSRSLYPSTPLFLAFDEISRSLFTIIINHASAKISQNSPMKFGALAASLVPWRRIFALPCPSGGGGGGGSAASGTLAQSHTR